jgi:two-component system sensor histidine kinase YesM
MWMNSIKRYVDNMKLRHKLIVSYLMASILPIILISLTIYHYSASNIEETSREFASMYVSQVVTSLDDFANRYDQVTQSIFVETDIMHLLKNPSSPTIAERIDIQALIQGYFQRIVTVNPDIEMGTLISPNGTVYSFTKSGQIVDTNELKEQTWFRRIDRSARHPLIITPVHDRIYYERDKQGVAFTVGRVLWNYDGSYAGILLFDLNPNQLVKLNKDFLMLGNRYGIRLTVANKEGGIIYNSDAATGKIDWKLVAQSANRGNHRSDSDSSFIQFLDNSDDGEFQVHTEIPVQKLLAKIGSIKRITLIVNLVCLLFILWLSLSFSFRITRPIRELRRSMRKVELGNYHPILYVSSSNDEIGGLVISYNKMIEKIRELIQDVYLSGMKQKEAQYLALQSQINPHMLFNTLESIRMKAVVSKQDDLAEMIKILGKMFKHTLRKERERNLIRHEVEYAANYLYMQNIRYANRFSLEVNLSEKTMETPIPSMVFQPIVENSVKHAFRDYKQPLHIRIDEILMPSNDVLIRISDNGVTLSPERAREINELLQLPDNEYALLSHEAQESGIGLRNISDRIKLRFGERYFVRIVADSSIGTAVETLIPLEKEQS